jgi:glycerol kinase
MLAGHRSGAWTGVLDSVAEQGGLSRFAPRLAEAERSRLVAEWQAAIRRATLT